MFIESNDYITGRKQIATSAGCEVVSTRFSLSLQAVEMTANNIGNIGILPAGCVPVAMIVDADQLDSGAAVTFAFGVSNAEVKNNLHGNVPTDISVLPENGGAVWVTAIDTAKQGGQAQFYSLALSRVKPVQYDRYLALKVVTAAATGVAGEIGVTLLYRSV